MPPARFSFLCSPRHSVFTPRSILYRTRVSSRRNFNLASRSKPSPPSFPVVETCPDPACPCSSMPVLDQEIDYKNTLNGTMSAHSQHLIISTGKNDWSSRIEDERENGTNWGKVTGDLKGLLGRKGEFHDVRFYWNRSDTRVGGGHEVLRHVFGATMISTASFTPLSLKIDLEQTNGDTTRDGQDTRTVDALLFPAFRHFRGLTPLSQASDDSAGASHPQTESQPDQNPLQTAPLSSTRSLKRFILENLTPLSFSSENPLLQTPSERTAAESQGWASTPITNPTILICSHGQRDSRCGILGPVLHDEFRSYIGQQTSDLRLRESHEFVASETADHLDSSRAGRSTREVNESPRDNLAGQSTSESLTATTSSASSAPKHATINVGMISHIGGHKWAGNVIIYIPPGFSASIPPTDDVGVSGFHPLAGMSIWYGRIEPKHVEGIIEQTILRGNIIKELFRGGLDVKGKVVRL